ncbi:MAG: tetratricopeptide repeat protein [Clostridia bacterium]
MIIEKIVVVFLEIILIFFLAARFIKRYAPENLVIIPIASLSLGLYIPFAINNINIPIEYQVFFLVVGIFCPSIAIILQYNNIILSRKLLYHRIKTNFSSKFYKETMKDIEKLVMLEGRSAKYMYILGQCYKHYSDFINSRDCFSLAIELDKNDYKSYYELGLVLDETNKKSKAIEMYKETLKIKPDFYEAAEAIGISLTSQGLFKEAVAAYREFLKIHINSYEMYYNIAMLEMELGNYESSEDAFLKAGELKPNLYTAFYNIGYLRSISGRYKEAIEAYKKVIQSTIYGAKAYYKIADLYASMEEKEKAMSAIEYAIELDPRYFKRAINDLSFSIIRDDIIKYEKNIKDIKEKEREKKNYMRDKFKILKFIKKVEDEQVQEEKIENNYDEYDEYDDII